VNDNRQTPEPSSMVRLLDPGEASMAEMTEVRACGMIWRPVRRASSVHVTILDEPGVRGIHVFGQMVLPLAHWFLLVATLQGHGG
jgi:hypothetical protein